MSDIHNIKSTFRGNAWLKTGVTHYHAQLGLSEKVVQSNGWLSAIDGMLVPFNLANSLTLRCYQLSPPRYLSIPLRSIISLLKVN